MKFAVSRFNYYLALTVVAALAAGCATSDQGEEPSKTPDMGKNKPKTDEAVIQFHLESEFDTGNKTDVVPIYRAAPVPVRVYKQPFLDTGSMIDAEVVDVLGGFAIRLAFDFHGQLALDNVSSSYRGSRIAIHASWPETRWLAAPKMNARITDGVLTFTPDATREEAEQIVQGLNKVAVKLGNRPKTGAKPKSD